MPHVNVALPETTDLDALLREAWESFLRHRAAGRAHGAEAAQIVEVTFNALLPYLREAVTQWAESR